MHIHPPRSFVVLPLELSSTIARIFSRMPVQTADGWRQEWRRQYTIRSLLHADALNYCVKTTAWPKTPVEWRRCVDEGEHKRSRIPNSRYNLAELACCEENQSRRAVCHRITKSRRTDVFALNASAWVNTTNLNKFPTSIPSRI
jgi:hypothetical protein